MSKKKKRFSFLDVVQEQVMKIASVSKTGQIKLKRSEMRKALDTAFEIAVKAAASGERVRFPVVGALARREVKARKAGKGVNPFTGEPMTIKARPATKKPRWSFPKTVKEAFANKRNW